MSDDNELRSEFRPPDEQMVDYMIGLSEELSKMATTIDMPNSSREVLEVASRSIKLLLAMAISGHTLFIGEGRRTDEIADVARSLYDILFLIEPSALDSVANLDVLRRYSEWESSPFETGIDKRRDDIGDIF